VGRSRLAAVAAAGAIALGAASSALATGEIPDAKPVPDVATWDQIVSIRGAAERIGVLHRTKGAKAAYELIDNCYRTHSLASSYGEGFESCIVQDYLETRTLIQVYSRMPPEALHKAGVPSPQQLATSMGQRISTAFSHYKKSQAYADDVKDLVDKHGLPVFLAIVFPEVARAIDEKAKQKKQPK
jgi:hypothetical protein